MEMVGDPETIANSLSLLAEKYEEGEIKSKLDLYVGENVSSQILEERADLIDLLNPVLTGVYICEGSGKVEVEFEEEY